MLSRDLVGEEAETDGEKASGVESGDAAIDFAGENVVRTEPAFGCLSHPMYYVSNYIQ